MYTLVVCETEPIVIEGLRSVLVPSADLRLVASESSLPEAVAATGKLRPSVLLLDKAFGVHALADCLRSLRQLHSTTAFVVWGASLSESESLRFLQAGATGMIRKTASLQTILECLRTVATGDTWLEHAGPSNRLTPGPPRSSLTAREMQVCELVERGLKNKDIAAALGIRTGTVKIHLKHIFEKTGIRGRFGLALSGLQEKGLLDLPALETV